MIRANAWHVSQQAGHEKLGERLKRALNLTEEAMLRAKKFVVKLMQGDVSYWGPEDQRPEEYFVGRLMLAIVVLEPKYLTGMSATLTCLSRTSASLHT